MPTRSIFNRRYSSFQSDGTTVYLANGQGNVTGSVPIISLTAGSDLQLAHLYMRAELLLFLQ